MVDSLAFSGAVIGRASCFTPLTLRQLRLPPDGVGWGMAAAAALLGLGPRGGVLPPGQGQLPHCGPSALLNVPQTLVAASGPAKEMLG